MHVSQLGILHYLAFLVFLFFHYDDVCFFAAFTSPTVTRKPELCRTGYSEWINRDSPASGDGDREVRHYQLHFHKYSLKAGWDEGVEVRWLLSWFDRVRKFVK